MPKFAEQVGHLTSHAARISTHVSHFPINDVPTFTLLDLLHARNSMATLTMNSNSVFHVPPPSSSALLNNEPALRVNDQDLTIMTVKGQYYWHVHASSDEMFYVMDGDLTLQMRPVPNPGDPERAEDDADRTIELTKGDIFVVPANTEHRSGSKEGAQVMFLLRSGSLDFMSDDKVQEGGKITGHGE